MWSWPLLCGPTTRWGTFLHPIRSTGSVNNKDPCRRTRFGPEPQTLTIEPSTGIRSVCLLLQRESFLLSLAGRAEQLQRSQTFSCWSRTRSPTRPSSKNNQKRETRLARCSQICSPFTISDTTTSNRTALRNLLQSRPAGSALPLIGLEKDAYEDLIPLVVLTHRLDVLQENCRCYDNLSGQVLGWKNLCWPSLYFHLFINRWKYLTAKSGVSGGSSDCSCVCFTPPPADPLSAVKMRGKRRSGQIKTLAEHICQS